MIELKFPMEFKFLHIFGCGFGVFFTIQSTLVRFIIDLAIYRKVHTCRYLLGTTQ